MAYVYAPDRTGERPIAHLNGFAGVPQVDGYGGYRQLARKNKGVLSSWPWPGPLKVNGVPMDARYWNQAQA